MICVGDPLLSHDRYALVTVHPPLSELNREVWLRRIKRVLRRDLHATVVYSEIYPFVVALLQFESAMVIDHLINTGCTHSETTILSL